MADTVQNGNWIVIKTLANLKVFKAVKGSKLKVGKLTFKADGAIGNPFGLTYMVEDGQLVLATDQNAEQLPAASKGVADNRNLAASSGSQKMTQEEIEALKKGGESGAAILTKVVESSSTFAAKTQYSQEKYIKAKSKKYSNKVVIEKPNTRLLCEIYFGKGPQKICNLRVDSLASVLLKANVRPYANIMVAETCQGLVTGAVLERVGANGNVVQIHPGDVPMMTTVDNYDFPDDVKASLRTYPLYGLQMLRDAMNTDAAVDANAVDANAVDTAGGGGGAAAAADGAAAAGSPDDGAADAAAKQLEAAASKGETVGGGGGSGAAAAAATALEPGTAEKVAVGTTAEGAKPDAEPPTPIDPAKAKLMEERRKRREAKRAQWKGTFELLRESNMDSLIIAVKYQPLPILKALLPLLAFSRPFVVFCEHKEPLLECFAYLRRYGAVNVHINERWTAEYQVLPGRTHPHMMMDSAAGFMLSGITVNNKTHFEPAGKRKRATDDDAGGPKKAK